MATVELNFKPERKGYYLITWMGARCSPNQVPQPITAEATIWAVNDRTTELGYRTGGVEIIADKDTFHVGRTRAGDARRCRRPDQYVLFTVEGQESIDYQLVHMDGTVKLVNLPLMKAMCPIFFWPRHWSAIARFSPIKTNHRAADKKFSERWR